MGIYDSNVSSVLMTADQKALKSANQVIQIFKRNMTANQRMLRQIRTVVANGGGKAAVAAKLGGDASEFQNWYNNCKSFVETFSTIEVESL